MPAITYDTTIEVGAKFEREYQWTDDAGDPAQDITGWKARMHVRKPIDSDDILLAAYSESADGNTYFTIDGPLATVTLLVPATVTATLEWSGRAFYDIELVPPDGGGWDEEGVVRLVEGRYRLKKNVTRS